MRSVVVAEGGGVPTSAGEWMASPSSLGWFASSMLMDCARFLVSRPGTAGSPWVSLGGERG